MIDNSGIAFSAYQCPKCGYLESPVAYLMVIADLKCPQCHDERLSRFVPLILDRHEEKEV